MNTIDEIQSEVTKNTINILLLPLNIHIEALDEVKKIHLKLVEQLLDDKIDGIKTINQVYESWDDMRTIIADIGLYNCKAGDGGDKVPINTIQTVCCQ